MIHVVAGIIYNNNQASHDGCKNEILIAKRQKGQHLQGLWEFPGGKVETDETPMQALQRELFEEIGIEIDPATAKSFQKITYQYPQKTVLLDFYQVTDFYGTAQGKEGQQVKWIKLDELPNYKFPEANQKIVEILC